MKKNILASVFFSSIISIFAADIYMAGDSTMQTYNGSYYPQQGWGQRMQELTIDGVKVSNQSLGGRSTKSFKAEGRWQRLVSSVKEGDFVIIQFGHNDATKAKPERYAEVNTEYKANMEGFIDDVRKAGGTPIIVSSIPQGNYLPDGHFKKNGFLDPYVNMALQVAKEKNCESIDLYRYACEEFDKIGEKKGLSLYNIFPAGKYTTQPAAKNDHTHIVFGGAYFYAAAFVKLAKDNKLSIAKLFKDLKEDPMTAALKEQPKNLVQTTTLSEADAAALAVLEELEEEEAKLRANRPGAGRTFPIQRPGAPR